MNDKLQQALWCVHQVISMRRIKRPRLPEGVIVAEMNAIVELHIILEQP
jgi:hypothetical protein